MSCEDNCQNLNELYSHESWFSLCIRLPPPNTHTHTRMAYSHMFHVRLSVLIILSNSYMCMCVVYGSVSLSIHIHLGSFCIVLNLKEPYECVCTLVTIQDNSDEEGHLNKILKWRKMNGVPKIEIEILLYVCLYVCSWCSR